jgi:hypothetical protein
MGGKLRILMLNSRRTGSLGSDIAPSPTGRFFSARAWTDSTFVLFMFYFTNDRPTRELAHAELEADGKTGR